MNIKNMKNTFFPIDGKYILLLVSSFAVSLSQSIFSGGDYWAETFAEYFDTIKGFGDLFNIGWGGYYSFFPQLIASLYHEYLSRWFEPWYVARFFSSVVLFTVSYIVLSTVLRFKIKKLHKTFIYISTLFSLVLTCIHPSSSSIISVGYILYFPLSFLMIFGSYYTKDKVIIVTESISKLLFVLALLTKPSLIFVSVFFGLRKSYVYKIIITLIFVIQYYLTAKSPHGLPVTYEVNANFLVDSFYLFFSISGLLVNRIFLFDAFTNYAIVVGAASFVFMLIYMIGKSCGLRVVIFYLSIVGSLIAPFLFLVLLFHERQFSLHSLISSVIKLQYWSLPNLCIPAIAFSLLCIRKLSKWAFSILGVIILSNQLVTSYELRNLSNSSNVSTDAMISNQIPEDRYWRCFPILPLPGFAINEVGERLGKLNNIPMDVWKSGGCHTELSYSYYSHFGFKNINGVIPEKIIKRGSYSYIVMIKNAKLKHTLFESSLECRNVYGNDPKITSSYGIGSFDYITGWSENSGAVDPNLMRDYLGKCFNIHLKQQEFNTILFFPDVK